MKRKKIGIYLFIFTSKFCSRWMATKAYLRILYFCRFGHFLDLNMPVTYNEKLQWMKLNDKNPEYTVDVDKFLVRNKVKALIGDDHLIPLLGHYMVPSEIDYDKLPSQFVLKCTHGTHCSIVCKNKNKFDRKKAEQLLKKWLKHNYYYDAREWPYKNIKPSIICEEYIGNNNLIDYKFLCFDGKVEYIMVHQDINNERGNHTLDIYTRDWVKTNIKWGIPNSSGILPRPEKLEECIRISEILSANKPHVRVDLYIVNETIYFGELTYYSAAGFKPFDNPSDDEMLGKLINIEDLKYAGN